MQILPYYDTLMHISFFDKKSQTAPLYLENLLDDIYLTENMF